MTLLVFWFCFSVLGFHVDPPSHGFPTLLLLSHNHTDSPVFSLCSSSEAKTLGLPPTSLPTSLIAYFYLVEKYPCVFTGLVLGNSVSCGWSRDSRGRERALEHGPLESLSSRTTGDFGLGCLGGGQASAVTGTDFSEEWPGTLSGLADSAQIRISEKQILTEDRVAI